MKMKREFMAANIDPKKVEDIIRECAKECILPYFRNLSPDDIQQKNDATMSTVTVADALAEEFLGERLAKLLPGSKIVGEEGTHGNEETAFDPLHEEGSQVWVIDPIDGTNNYSKGSETFCVMLALVEDNEVKKAWIYDACNDSMAYAEKGKGTFIDGQKVTIDNDPPKTGDVGYTTNRAGKQIPDISIKTLRCSGHEYLNILKGKAIFALYSVMKPWDHLAGTFMVKEAGGYVAKWDGSPYTARDSKGGLITANSKATWDKVHGAIPQQALERHKVSP